MKSLNKNRIRTIWDWVKEINEHKTQSHMFSDEDWDKFNSYTINKALSMNHEYLDIVNEIQIIPPTEKSYFYNIYKDLLPINRKFYKFIGKPKNKYNNDLVIILKEYYKLSSSDVKDYLDLLTKENLKDILKSLGYNDKEIKPLLK